MYVLSSYKTENHRTLIHTFTKHAIYKEVPNFDLISLFQKQPAEIFDTDITIDDPSFRLFKIFA